MVRIRGELRGGHDGVEDAPADPLKHLEEEYLNDGVRDGVALQQVAGVGEHLGHVVNGGVRLGDTAGRGGRAATAVDTGDTERRPRLQIKKNK